MPRIHLTDPQARALLDHARFADRPSHMNGRTGRALNRAVDKLRAALEAVPAHPLIADLDRLTNALLDVRAPAFLDLIHGRARDLLTVALLWTAAEELPADVRAPLLDLDRLPDPAWAADVLDACAQHGLRVRLPSEAAGDEPDRGGG